MNTSIMLLLHENGLFLLLLIQLWFLVVLPLYPWPGLPVLPFSQAALQPFTLLPLKQTHLWHIKEDISFGTTAVLAIFPLTLAGLSVLTAASSVTFVLIKPTSTASNSSGNRSATVLGTFSSRFGSGTTSASFSDAKDYLFHLTVSRLLCFFSYFFHHSYHYLIDHWFLLHYCFFFYHF